MIIIFSFNVDYLVQNFVGKWKALPTEVIWDCVADDVEDPENKSLTCTDSKTGKAVIELDYHKAHIKQSGIKNPWAGNGYLDNDEEPIVIKWFTKNDPKSLWLDCGSIGSNC